MSFCAVKLLCPSASIFSAHAYEIGSDVVALISILSRLCVVKRSIFQKKVLYLLAVIIYQVAKACMQVDVVQVLDFYCFEVPYPCRRIQDYMGLAVMWLGKMLIIETMKILV